MRNPRLALACLALWFSAVGARAWVSGGNGDTAALVVSFYSGAGCSHSLANAATPNATAKAWTQTAVLAVAPAGTVSAMVNIDTGRGAGALASVPLNAYVDDVYSPGTTFAPVEDTAAFVCP